MPPSAPLRFFAEEEADMAEFIRAAIVALHLMAATPEEISTLRRLAAIESCNTPSAVNGPCCGLWQTDTNVCQRALDSSYTCEALRTEPIKAARCALVLLRKHRSVCGKAWECGWFTGPYTEKCTPVCQLRKKRVEPPAEPTFEEVEKEVPHGAAVPLPQDRPGRCLQRSNRPRQVPRR